MAVSPVLPTGRYHCGRPAALRDFSPVYDRYGSVAPDREARDPDGMSASPQKRRSAIKMQIRRSVPIADKVRRSKKSLFDDLVGAGEQRRRHFDAERSRRIDSK